MSLFYRIASLALFFSVVSALPAAKPPIDVYILAGQSNMVGCGESDQLPAPLSGVSPQQIIVGGTVASGGWQYVHPGLGNDSNAFGPEIGFAHTIAAKSALIKYAASGTSLAVDWRPDGELYQAFVAFVRGALQQLGAKYSTNVRAFVWVHGETDALLGGAASARYLDNLVIFVGRVRADIAPAMTFVVSDINQTSIGPGMREVRMAQHLAPDVIAKTCLVSTAALETPDGLHYGPAGYLELGSRLAEAADAITPALTVGNAPVMNQSVRTNIHPADGPLIAGFVVGGDRPVKVLIRGLSHTLTRFGVTGVLPDPALTLYRGGERVSSNDTAAPYLNAVFARVGAVPLDSDREAALLVELEPGVYSAHLTDSAKIGGAALLELYFAGY